MKLVGAQLAMFREFAGLRQRELAERVCVHEETIASVEQGRRPLKPDLAKVLDRVLDTKRALETAVDNMPEIDRFPVWAAEFMDAEREAIAICSYQNQVVPGLLQTDDYARAVFLNEIPVLSEDEMEQRVVARMERQEILHRTTPPTCSFLITQAVLMDQLGDTQVYAQQLRHLRACADLPGIAFQIMPFGRARHAGLSGPFVLLETRDHQHLAYAETQRGSQFVSDPDEVSILARKYAMLRTQALNPEETKGLLDRLLGEL
ncbi:helix-turn-helix transcriptional regulator [Streptomyces lunaelactis]|nr:helix-turn-helix transcriptional regulator [Streptomyces lunaelactis]NUK25546.1 helix-turn-helix transcriptional regulator [Streptomyces lunaelactis]NUK60241.1 helix-turn-helix transcriptional regulator [Streptomyces lunaelactis]NUK74375.1 helix-turn-helix transcriptional regulator [Streptomyces lunaelactis]NUK76961.1 helix-turn-helix transcriptional regulator [Streptomyces lunaelactis]